MAVTAVLQAAELRLDGYNLSRTAVPSGGTFDIDLAWTATDFPQARYQSNVWLVGPDGLTWSDVNTFRPRLYEDAPDSRAWLPGQWGWDSREVTVLRGTPPGQYDIVLTLFDFATLQPITLLNGNGAVVGPTAVLGQITVTEPEAVEAASDALGQIQGISLLEYRQDRAAAVPGDVVLLTFFWERPSGQPTSDTFDLELRDANERHRPGLDAAVHAAQLSSSGLASPNGRSRPTPAALTSRPKFRQLPICGRWHRFGTD